MASLKDFFQSFSRNFLYEEKVLTAVLRSSVINLLSRFFGYLKNLIIAYVLGFNYKTDSIFMALSIVGIFNTFAEVFDSLGVPELVKAKKKSKENFYFVLKALYILTLFISVLSIVFFIVFMPIILKIPIGFDEHTKGYLKIVLLFLSPFVFFYFWFHYFGAILRSIRLFSIYFLGELLFSFTTFLCMIIGFILLKDYKVVPISISISIFLATLVLFITVKKRVYVNFKVYSYEFKNFNILKKFVKEFFYLAILYSIFYIYTLTDKIFGSLLGEKVVSALTYGFLLAIAFKNILKFEHIAITSLSESGADLRKVKFYLKKLIVISIPVLLFLYFFAELIVELLLGHGAFSNIDLFLTTKALKYYALSIPFVLIWPIIFRVLQIKKEYNKIVFIAIIGVIINIILNYILTIKFSLGIKGICFSTFMSYFFICSAGYIIIMLKR